MTTFERIAATVTELSSAETPRALKSLARSAGMSAFHFQRTFTRLVGMSPLRFHQAVRLEAAREALSRSATVLDAAWDAGFSTPSRLHDAMVRLERMTPGEFKSGLTLRWTTATTELGPFTLAASSRGLCGAAFGELDGLRERWPHATFTRDDAAMRPFSRALSERLAGRRLERPLSVVLGGTGLQVAVWRALLALPDGTVTTYGALATQVGAPKAVRAVASAVGANPIAYLIPCHRVIRAGGALGEYRWGSARKAALLARELTSRGA